MRRTGPGPIVLFGAWLAVSSTAACSFIFTQPLRDEQRQWGGPDCATDLAPPTLDTVLFLAYAGTTGYVAAQNNVSDKSLQLAVGATGAAIWLASAVYGFVETTQCRSAQRGPPAAPLHPIGSGPVFYQGRPVGVPEPVPMPAPRVDAPPAQAPAPPPGDASAKPDGPRDGG